MARRFGSCPRRRLYPVLGLLLLLPLVPAVAQEVGRPTVGVAAGPSSYDLSGTGTSFVIAARLELRVRSIDPFGGTTADFTVGLARTL